MPLRVSVVLHSGNFDSTLYAGARGITTRTLLAGGGWMSDRMGRRGLFSVGAATEIMTVARDHDDTCASFFLYSQMYGNPPVDSIAGGCCDMAKLFDGKQYADMLEPGITKGADILWVGCNLHGTNFCSRQYWRRNPCPLYSDRIHSYRTRIIIY